MNYDNIKQITKYKEVLNELIIKKNTPSHNNNFNEYLELYKNKNNLHLKWSIGCVNFDNPHIYKNAKYMVYYYTINIVTKDKHFKIIEIDGNTWGDLYITACKIMNLCEDKISSEVKLFTPCKLYDNILYLYTDYNP
jgi:hypothetical protein